MTKKSKAQSNASAEKKSKSKKTCALLGPYGATEAEHRYREDLHAVLTKVFSEDLTAYQYKPFWAHPTTDMQSEIYSMLIDSDLAIVDLRGLNPNVMYELGIRHAFNFPTILLRDPQTRLPWDIDKNFCLEYPLPIQASQVTNLATLIKEHVLKVEKLDKKTANYSSFNAHAKRSAKIQSATKTDAPMKDVLTNLSNQVTSLSDRMTKISSGGGGFPLATLERDSLIKMLALSGRSQTEVAEMFNITPGRVNQIVNGG